MVGAGEFLEKLSFPTHSLSRRSHIPLNSSSSHPCKHFPELASVCFLKPEIDIHTMENPLLPDLFLEFRPLGIVWASSNH